MAAPEHSATLATWLSSPHPFVEKKNTTSLMVMLGTIDGEADEDSWANGKEAEGETDGGEEEGFIEVEIEGSGIDGTSLGICEGAMLVGSVGGRVSTQITGRCVLTNLALPFKLNCNAAFVTS